MSRGRGVLGGWRRVLVSALGIAGVGVLAATSTAGAGHSRAPSLAFSPSTYSYGSVAVGDTASHVFTLTNSGGSGSAVLRLAPLSPTSTPFRTANDHCSATSLGPRKFCSVTVIFAPTSPGLDTATLTATSKKGATAALRLVGTGAQQADLSVAKTVSDSTPNVGDTVSFTVTLANAGPDAATNVAVQDLLPAGLSFVSATPSQGTYSSGTWTVGTVIPGSPQTLVIGALVVSPNAQTNTASISHSDQFDPNTANNSDSATVIPL